MSIPAGTDTRKEEVGNGVKVAFDFDFKIFANTDIKVFTYVTATGVQTPKVLTTDYTVAINGIDNALTTAGGTVTYNVAPLASETSLILGDYDIDQLTELETAGNIPEVVLEDGYDKLTLIALQQQEEIDRCLKQEESASGGITFPTADVGKALKWADSTTLENSTYDPDEQVTLATTQATNAATSASNAATSETNAATSETNAAASATAATNAASKGPKTHEVAWAYASATTITVESGTAFKGVATNTWFNLTANRTFDITTSDVAGGLEDGSSRAVDTDYYLLGIGDTSGTNPAHCLAVTKANYAAFTVSDLPTGYDDYKRIGTFKTNSTGSGEIESGDFRNGFLSYAVAVANDVNSTSSATFVDIDFSDVIDIAIVKDIECAVYNASAATVEYRLNGGSRGVPIFQSGGAAGSASVRLRLDSSGIFETKTSAGTVSYTISGFYDDLDIEGQ